MERIIANRLFSHYLLAKFQSAYRKFHSSEIAHLNEHNYFLDAGHYTALLHLDLLAAFDTIGVLIMIIILIHRMRYWLSISFSALNLLSVFLSVRFQTVFTSKTKSQSVLLEYGVPQGSIF